MRVHFGILFLLFFGLYLALLAALSKNPIVFAALVAACVAGEVLDYKYRTRFGISWRKE